jgi:predicted XRE-type DNA-binding protein
MKISKQAKQMAEDLGLSEIDAYILELKAKLYSKCAKLIKNSNLTHESIAKAVGTSRARISRLGNMGENSVSIELLIKISTVLDDKAVIKVVA